jgi:hypothetical protein
LVVALREELNIANVQNGGKNAEDVGLLNFRDPECGERVPG